MSMIIGLYDDLATAQQAVSDLETHNFDKNSMHLATYDRRATRRQSGGFFESLSQLFGSDPKDIGGQDRLVQQLTHWGVDEGDAQSYAEALRRGSTLVLINAADDRSQEARQIMEGYGPQDIDERAAQWQQQGWQGYDAKAPRMTQEEMDRERNRYATGRKSEGEVRMPEVEEGIRVDKRNVQRGGVRVYRTVTEQPVEQTHMVRDETVNVQRRDADRAATDADLGEAFQEQTFDITENDEELVVDKTARVTGEVVVNKDVEERPQTVRDTVRRTEVHTENLGQGGQADFGTHEPQFRQHYQRMYSNRGYDFNQMQPAYRYGYELAGSGRYSGRDWSQVETEAQRDWELQHPNSKWADVKDAIRYGWESMTGNAP